MFNATKVTSRLVVGGGIAGQDEIDWLKAQGVTHVVDVAAELDDATTYRDSGLAFLHIDWHDDGTRKPQSDFLAALRFVLDADVSALGSGRLPVFYVHCHAGINRGPLMASFLLAALSGLPIENAYEAIRAVRPQTNSFSVDNYRQSALDALASVSPFRDHADYGTAGSVEALDVVADAADAAADGLAGKRVARRA